MILSRKLSDALNEQINMEMWSSNLYLAMSFYMEKDSDRAGWFRALDAKTIARGT